jgi:hypothetical protein
VTQLPWREQVGIRLGTRHAIPPGFLLFRAALVVPNRPFCADGPSERAIGTIRRTVP